METIEALKDKIATAEDLQSVVTTMKSLAAVSIHQYERAAESIDKYGDTVRLGLQAALMDVPAAEMPVAGEAGGGGAVLFGAEQGMSGRFNDFIVDHAFKHVRAHGRGFGGVSMLAVGDRIVDDLQGYDVVPDAVVSYPGSVATIPGALEQILESLDAWRFGKGVSTVWLFYNRPQSGSAYETHTETLLPLPRSIFDDIRERSWESNSLPRFTIQRKELLAALVREYLFVNLYRAFVQSLAAENASRLSAMQAAEKNIGERLNELTMSFNRRRQTAITEELLDIVSGFEALKKE